MVIYIRFIKLLLKKIIISSFFLYLYNILFDSFNLILPINFYTISTISMFGFVGFVGLIVFKILFL